MSKSSEAWQEEQDKKMVEAETRYQEEQAEAQGDFQDRNN